MPENMQLTAMPQFCAEVEAWLKARYGEAEGARLWAATRQQYNEYLKDLPDYGGKSSSHALAIYGAVVIFSLYPLLPDHPPMEELQDFVTSLFMASFVKLGKLFNLNRSFDMWLINKVFQSVGDKDRKQFAQYPASFCNVSEPYDKRNHAARYHFAQCPNAEFAKKARPDARSAAFLQFGLLGDASNPRHADPLRNLRQRRQMRLLRGRVRESDGQGV